MESKNTNFNHLLNIFGILLLLANIILFFSFNQITDDNQHLQNVRKKRSSKIDDQAPSTNSEQLLQQVDELAENVMKLGSNWQSYQKSMAHMESKLIGKCAKKRAYQWQSEIITDEKQCGGVLRADKGLIQYKPNQKYSNNEYCIWTILPTKTTLTFNITKHGFRGFDDMLTIFHIKNTTGELEILRNFGNPTNHGATLTTTAGHAMVAFMTGYDRVGTGFQMEFVASGAPVGDTGYTAVHNEINHGRYDSYPEYAASQKKNVYHIVTQSVYDEDFVFTSELQSGNFHFTNSSGTCAYDRITAYELETKGYYMDIHELGQLPNTSNSSCTEAMELHKVPKWFTTKKAPFILIYRQVHPRSSVDLTWTPLTGPDKSFSTKCGGSVVGDFGYISYKDDFPYANNEDCTWKVKSLTPNRTIYFTIEDEGFEPGDRLGVRVKGKNKYLSKSKRTSPWDDHDKNLLVEASEATLRFTSDGSQTGIGFLVVYRTREWEQSG